jgi:3-methylcrotonyl-CoA carboxylase alpha subunit
LSYLQAPAESRHVRIDTGVRQGDEVSVYYDPLIAKLVVWDEDRPRALQRLTTALADYRISGMTTNIDFLYNLASSAAFQRAQLDTGFIERNRSEIFHQQAQDLNSTLPLAALYLVLAQAAQAAAASAGRVDPWSPWHQANGWRLNEPHLHHFALTIQDQDCQVSVEQHGIGAARRYVINHHGKVVQARGELKGDTLFADLEGHRLRATVVEHDGVYSLYTRANATQFRLQLADLGDAEPAPAEQRLAAPMNGTVVTLLVASDSPVRKGDPLLVMEAMKMEHTIRAPADGTVLRFYYQAGDLVDGGAQLLEFAADA